MKTDKEKKNPTVAQKTVRVVGKQKWVNAETGEVEEFAVTQVEERDFDFHKVWLRNFLVTIELLGTSKIQFALWLCEQMDYRNTVVMTQRRMADESGISLQTVSRTLRILQDCDAIRSPQQGVYLWNPDIIFKGSAKSRAGLATIYSEAPFTPLTEEEKLANILAQIGELQKTAEKMKENISLSENLRQQEIREAFSDYEKQLQEEAIAEFGKASKKKADARASGARDGQSKEPPIVGGFYEAPKSA